MALYVDTCTGVRFVAGVGMCAICDAEETNVFPANDDGHWVGPISLIGTKGDDVTAAIQEIEDRLQTAHSATDFARAPYTDGWEEGEEEMAGQEDAYRLWLERLFRP